MKTVKKNLKIKNTLGRLIDGYQGFEFKNGFTLLEMTVAIGIFSFLVVAAVGTMLGLAGAQLRAQANQSVLDNARFGLELLTKELRTGYQYGTVSFCSMNALSPVLTFKHANSNPSDNSGRTYYLIDTDRDPDTDPDTLVRSKRIIANSSECYLQSGDTGASKFLEFSAEEVIIQELNIVLRGQTAGASDGQPNITTSIKLKARNPKGDLANPVTIQTTVVQRLRDIQ